MQIAKRIETEAGFTLMELVVVLAILAMLAALAIPQFGKVLENSAAKSDHANILLVETAVEVYRADNGKLPEVTGNDGTACFNSLIATLNDGEYLKNSEIKPQVPGNSFVYDKDKGNVSIIFTDPGVVKQP